MTRRDAAFRVGAALLVAWFVAAQLLRSVEPLALDQALFACFTRWVPRGWLPYRDLFDSKPPLFLYSYALAPLFPGGLVRGIWELEAAWLAGTMALAFALGRRLLDRFAGLAAAALIFAAEWAPGWGGWWSRAQADEFAALPMLAAAWLAWRAIDRERLALWAGVLTGVAGLFKIPAMAVAGAWPLTWLLVAGLRPAARRTAWMVLGLVAPWALAVGWFAAHHALGEFFGAVFVYHRHNAEFIAPPWPSVLLEFFGTWVVAGVLPLVAAVVGVTLADRRERAWLVPWIALTALAVILERQLAGYQYLLALPALAMAGGIGVGRIARARRSVALALGALLILLAVVEGVRWGRAYGDGLQVLSGRWTRERYLRRFEQGPFSPATEEEAGRWLAAHTTPTDGVLIWGLSPGIYALADRHPVTRYPFHKLLLTDAPLSRMIPGLAERRSDFLKRLNDDPPAYILVGRRDPNGFEPEDSFSSMMRFDELRQLLENRYARETELGRFLVFRRR